MCGIFAYIGNSDVSNASDIVFRGLKKLEYRGYDSWGIASLISNTLDVNKQIGKIGSKPQFPNSNISIGHTRWATHGGVNQINAHPHYSTDKSFVVVHNGIVENFQELKLCLIEEGLNFDSETDTEVIVKLIEKQLENSDDFSKAIQSVYKIIQGRNTILVFRQDGLIIGARNGSPLVMGKSQKGEYYLSSDTYSFADVVNEILVLDNFQMIKILNNEVELIDMESGNLIEIQLEPSEYEQPVSSLGNFKHFMEKEIHETPEALQKILDIKQTAMEELADIIKISNTVYFIGSGTAANAAAQSAYYLRKHTGIKAIALIGADCKEYWDLFTDKDLIIALSQSGETADVIEVLEVGKKKKTKISSLVNMPGSMMTRLSDFKFMSNSGPEICVLSTKVFTAQIAWGYLLAKSVQGKYNEGKSNLLYLSKSIFDLIRNEKWIENLKSISRYLSSKSDIFLLGKGEELFIVKEGMVKIIEGSYIHAHAIPAGDLKHYAITLIEKGVDVLSVIPGGDMKKDLISSLNQVKARGATVTGISSEKDEIFDHWIQIPEIKEITSIISIIPLQLLAYYLALYLGHDIDKPRNIAKSVTVK